MCQKPAFLLGFVFMVTLAIGYILSPLYVELCVYLYQDDYLKIKHNWIIRLIENLLGYCTIFVPGFLLYHYVKRSKFLEKTDNTCLNYIVRELFLGLDSPKGYINIDTNNQGKPQQNLTLLQQSVKLSCCSLGLLIMYLTWGLLQEKVMTQKYMNSSGETGQFNDSQFLVFVNRILAFLLSGACILICNQQRHTVPFYKYSFCSLSNIMSSWCQYEALKFINFPTQVLAKASKLIPVMLMSTIISKKKYDCFEYLVAVLICFGMGLFLYGSSDVTKNDQTVTTVSGIILIIGYMVFDSFTSNWQSELFSKYSTSSIQMMCGVNLFSCLLTMISLLQEDSYTKSAYFMIQFPAFAVDCLLLSICSAIGQLFVFYTISVFGPIVFVIIMTIRQMLAIILSCVLYHHIVYPIGIVGIVTVFFSIFFRIYLNQKAKTNRKRIQTSSV